MEILDGATYFEKFYTHKLKLQNTLPFIIFSAITLFLIWGIIDSIIRKQQGVLVLFSMFLGVIILFIFLPIIIVFSLRLKYKWTQNRIARELGVKVHPMNNGLMREGDIQLEQGEVMIKFFPAMWYRGSFKKAPRFNKMLLVHIVSVAITNHRIIIGGSRGRIIYFPNFFNDNKLLFDSVDKDIYPADTTAQKIVANQLMKFTLDTMKGQDNAIKELGNSLNRPSDGLWINGLAVWHQIPKTINRPANLVSLPPIEKVKAKQKEGFVVDRVDLFPENMDYFIQVVKDAQKV